jgi:predicted nucleic acid-binding protein
VTIVANAGPLIALARIGQFELLHLLYDELYVPTSVRDEVTIFGQTRPGAVEVEAAEWI